MEVKYYEGGDLAVFDNNKFRLDKETGYYLKSTPPRLRLHRYIWEHEYGSIPDGFHIHHKDEDKSNNSLDNLELIDGRKHASYHAKERVEQNYNDVVDKLLKYAVPKSKEWHSSQEGKEWHSAHHKETIANMKEKEYTCKQCGKVFFEKPLGRIIFCSNNCKSAYRRQSGIDNETRICKYCGNEFTVNKYSKTVCCSRSCGKLLRR